MFNKRLGDFLKNLFLEVALMISIGLAAVIFLYFVDWQLSLAVVAPIGFALCATLGTLNIIGHIPGIMLWIVIMGMGIDYAIYYVCTCQRYPDEKSPAMQIIKLAIFLAAFTTLIGFELSLDGTLIIRATILSDKNLSKRWMETAELTITGTRNSFRRRSPIVDFMSTSGFIVSVSASHKKSIEEKWFVGKGNIKIHCSKNTNMN